ncbi:MAG: DUF4399 domain-containing protein [Actinobacteria bacterium]|nr:DUF4399 domain-containing protein [Actinomycetota bacterium]
MYKKLLIAILLFLFPLSTNAQGASEENVVEIASDNPTLNIITPSVNDQILGETVIVNFIVNDFDIVNFTNNKKNQTNQGHLHLYIDNMEQIASNSQEIVKPTSIKLDKMPEGKHTLTLELVNNNHTPLKPAVIQTVSFTTKAETKIENTPPQPTITKDMEKIKKVQGMASITTTISNSLIIIFVVLIGAYVIFKLRNS